MGDFEKKAVVISGASSGFGRAAALHLAREGATVFAVARRAALLEQLSEQAGGLTGAIEPCVCDITHDEEVKNLSRAIAQQVGHLDLLVNNAGMGMVMPLQVVQPAQVRSLIDVNVVAAILLTKALLRLLKNGGNVINISSAGAIVGDPGISAYAATKGALISLTRSLAAELAPQGIRVNAIAPGMVKTALFDDFIKNLSEDQVKEIEKRHLLGFGREKNIIDAIMFMGSDRASWITGQCLIVDGGYSL